MGKNVDCSKNQELFLSPLLYVRDILYVFFCSLVEEIWHLQQADLATTPNWIIKKLNNVGNHLNSNFWSQLFAKTQLQDVATFQNRFLEAVLHKWLSKHKYLFIKERQKNNNAVKFSHLHSNYCNQADFFFNAQSFFVSTEIRSGKILSSPLATCTGMLTQWHMPSCQALFNIIIVTTRYPNNSHFGCFPTLRYIFGSWDAFQSIEKFVGKYINDSWMDQ